ncbi:MAG: M15 family metallopeptidase [Alphaproteobacteria bacterium]
MNSDLLFLKNTPIPDLASMRALRAGYRNQSLDSSSPYFDEPLVDLLALGLCGKNYYHRPDNRPYFLSVPGAIPQLYARQTIGKKLLAINAAMKNFGYRIFLHDAYRPLAVQQFFHDQWMPAFVKKNNPHFDHDAIMAETEKYWAIPSDDPLSPSPHLSGAAVDITLMALDDDREIDMGSQFDEFTELSHTDHFERAGGNNIVARNHRRILYGVMIKAGFANHPNEWWHFSWGDQMWARLSGEVKGFYGLATMPSA